MQHKRENNTQHTIPGNSEELINTKCRPTVTVGKRFHHIHETVRTIKSMSAPDNIATLILLVRNMSKVKEQVLATIQYTQ